MDRIEGSARPAFILLYLPLAPGPRLKENMELYKKGSYIDYVLDSFLLLLVDVGGPRRFGVTQEQL